VLGAYARSWKRGFATTNLPMRLVLVIVSVIVVVIGSYAIHTLPTTITTTITTTTFVEAVIFGAGIRMRLRFALW
jgi:hypothetical protein